MSDLNAQDKTIRVGHGTHKGLVATKTIPILDMILSNVKQDPFYTEE
jgi:hypothetical protein